MFWCHTHPKHQLAKLIFVEQVPIWLANQNSATWDKGQVYKNNFDLVTRVQTIFHCPTLWEGGRWHGEIKREASELRT